MRIAIAGFMHESNTFSPLLADRSAFVAQGLAQGNDLLAEWKDAHHEVGGFLSAADELGVKAVPLVMAWAMPSGPVTDDVFDEITSIIVQGLQKLHVDGLLLALHGAMVTSSHLDADAEIVARIRAGVGRGFPLAVTFDLHGNLSERVPDLCDIVIAYRTNPHIDQRQRGRQTAQLLFRWVHGEIRPRLALAKPPFLINIMKQDTSCPPLQHWMQRIDQLEQEPGILSASLLPGFAYADVPQIGPSVLVVSDGDVGLAQKRADDLAHQLWEDREAFQVALPNAAAAVQMALAEEHLPVVLVDTGDNVGGGSAGDGTVLLAELLRQHATKFVVCLYAPDEVRRCASSGIAAEVALRVGGKVDRLHGDPVEIAGIVRLLHDGTYEETAVRHGGKRLNHMGQTAVVELPGESLLVLTTYRHPPFSLGALTCLGICPSVMRILVVKAAIAYKSAYGPIAGSIIEVATPGLTVIDPQALPYRHRRRPLWPLDQG